MNGSLNQTVNQTSLTLSNIIIDKFRGGIDFLLSISNWVSNTLFSWLPESVRIYASTAFTYILPTILALLFIYGLVKSVKGLFGFIVKFVIPILLVIFFMLIVFAVLGVNTITLNNSTINLPPPIT